MNKKNIRTDKKTENRYKFVRKETSSCSKEEIEI